MLPDHEPDGVEKGIRFGCGLIFGFVMAFFWLLGEIAAFTGTFWASVGGIALVMGFMAMKFGDEFWRRVVNGDWSNWS